MISKEAEDAAKSNASSNDIGPWTAQPGTYCKQQWQSGRKDWNNRKSAKTLAECKAICESEPDCVAISRANGNDNSATKKTHCIRCGMESVFLNGVEDWGHHYIWNSWKSAARLT